MNLIDGKKLAKQIRQEIAAEVAELVSTGKRKPHLAAILVGEDPASQSYVKSKVKACEKAGFKSSLLKFPSDVDEKTILEAVNQLNNDPLIDGFIVQLPLPDQIDELKVTLAVDPAKDVDGFHPTNIGRMVQSLPAYIPATPFGILQMLERYKIETSGKHCVVIGRSNIVGTPMALLLSRNNYPGNCTVTLTHSRTQNLEELTKSADILIAAIGKPCFIKADMLKEGAVVIDVGINRVEDASAKRGYRLVGDVEFSDAAPKCSYITPVPGGVGPMTVTALLQNTLKAFQKEVYKPS